MFASYKGQNRKNAIADLKETFRKLKFYSNSDFAFKDVHNEELFQQNGKILIEVVKLFENYKIVYSSRHQFLGDLFEQLLDQGFKQNEGQFFTPIPITRFIWESLPVKQLSENLQGDKHPKVIDYSCGSGHFLTEGIETINTLIKGDNNDWVSEKIYGIEKDYRLARVSKISLFMNGAGDGNIIFGDGLDNHKDKGIANKCFDILVANPPYSVKAFKAHLKLQNNDFELLDCISNDGGEIEVLFVERIAQLLKPNGIAAVILPSSILSNSSESYMGARDILLKNFKIISIAQLGAKTFGATNTNTVVLFLQKYNEPPTFFKMVEDNVQAVFNNEKVDDWKDNEVLNEYLDHIGVDGDMYIDFIAEKSNYDYFEDDEHFKMYVDTFRKSTKFKKTLSSTGFNKLNKDEKSKKINAMFYTFAKSVEMEKLFYFALVKDQETLVIKAPSEKAEQTEFLGYSWSGRKGDEGIQIKNEGGVMYDPKNRDSNERISPLVRRSFTKELIGINEKMAKYASVLQTKNMLDFEREKFDKAIRLACVVKFQPVSKFPLKTMETVFKGSLIISKGTSITKEQATEQIYKVVAGGISYAYLHGEYNRNENVITISASGANAGYVNFWPEKIFASDCTTIQSSDLIATKYVFYYLKAFQNEIFKLARGAAQPHVYPDDIKKFYIPEIPDTSQETIVNKCDKLEKQYETTRMKIEDYKAQIKQIFEELDVIKSDGGGYRLSDSNVFTLSIGKRVLQTELVENGIPVYSANVFEPVGKINKYLIKNFDDSYIIWGIDGDWMVNALPRGYEFYPTDHCGVMTVDESKVNPKYMAYLLEKEGKKVGFSRTLRASIDRIKNISVEVPNIILQNEAMEKIAKLESKITELEKHQINLNKEIDKVLKRELN